MKCLITDAVYPGIEEELSRYMVCTNTAGKPLSKAEMIEAIGDVDILIMRVDPAIDRPILEAAKKLKFLGVCSVGLNHVDMNAAKAAFAEFLNDTNLDSRQIYFVNQIVEYIVQNGMMKDLSVLQEAPFTDRGSIVEVFSDLSVWMGIRKVIEQVNANATAA